MNFMVETSQPIAPNFVSHGIPTVDTSDKNCRIWSPDIRIRGTPNITDWSASENSVGQGTAVGDAVADYRKENYKTDYKIRKKIINFKVSPKILKGVDHLWI